MGQQQWIQWAVVSKLNLWRFLFLHSKCIHFSSQGNSMVEPEIWLDAIVLTPSLGDVSHANAVVLAVFSSTGQLDFLQTYTVTKTIVVKTSVISGTFYISVIPDFKGKVKEWFAVAVPGFPVGGLDPLAGGVDFRCRCFLVKMCVKTKELDPIGGHVPGMPHRSANGYVLIYSPCTSVDLHNSY